MPRARCVPYIGVEDSEWADAKSTGTKFRHRYYLRAALPPRRGGFWRSYNSMKIPRSCVQSSKQRR